MVRTGHPRADHHPGYCLPDFRGRKLPEIGGLGKAIRTSRERKIIEEGTSDKPPEKPKEEAKDSGAVQDRLILSWRRA